MKQIPEVVKTGGLTGQGFSNLLGRPRLGPLPLVLREGVQNSWDARRRRSPSPLRFSVRVRDLESKQDREFRKIFDQAGSLEPTRSNSLARQLKQKGPIRVLELSDFGTVGLTGSTRPDLPSGGAESRFVNFFFDVGRSHEESGDGGTYGFGRSSLYTAGRASLILVDSLAEGGDRRLMACRIGDSFEVAKGWTTKGRYSGRHFWGEAKHGIAQPVIGAQATAIAARLGLPARSQSQHTGTTILVPWPVDGFDDGAEIAKTLLHHLWPKMVPRATQPTIGFDVEVDGRRFPVEDPETLDEYRLFVNALRVARSRREGSGARVIETLRPRHVTGYLGLEVGIVNHRQSGVLEAAAEDENDSESVPSCLNHVALMRPSELVVRYLPVTGTDLGAKSWAAVFVCEDEEFVRTAFARSEPPAHDDWIADRLQEKHERYVVRKTVSSLLPEAVRNALGVGRAGLSAGDDAGASLAAASARFSATFLSGDGQGASNSEIGRATGGTVGTGGGNSRSRVSTPEVLGLEIRRGARIATFTATVHAGKDRVVVIRAIPSIHAEGTLDTPPTGLKEPSIVGWSGGVSRGDRCEVTVDRNNRKDIQIQVQFHGDYGLTLDCVVEERLG